MSVAMMPFTRMLRALMAAASSTLRGRPPLRPFAAAAASPARVRSIMASRSSCAKAAMMVSIALPIAPSVSRPSVMLRKPTPRDSRSSTTDRTCWVFRLATSEQITRAMYIDVVPGDGVVKPDAADPGPEGRLS